eukprot:COSAG02_NODE_664_length_18739_cov_11.071567_7_plen_69_part_00
MLYTLNRSYLTLIFTKPACGRIANWTVEIIFPTEPCVLRTFGHDGKLNTCAQSVPKKFRDRLHANENQ